jgi:pimeloyl-ACP methyl ester carboxylesterase
MHWTGKKWEYIVTIGAAGWEAFQITQDAEGKCIFHPSIKRAHPEMEHKILGPVSHGHHGYDWVLGRAGFNPFGKDLLEPGSQHIVRLYVNEDGNPTLVKWDMFDLDDAYDEESRPSGDHANVLDTDHHHKYYLAGTWNDWTPEEIPMKWNGRCFERVVRLKHKDYESFQILQDKTWDRRVYPSKNRAHPYMQHELLGPDSKGAGYNWEIGHSDAGTGSKYKVKFFLNRDGTPKRVTWQRYKHRTQQKKSVMCIAGLASSCLETEKPGGGWYGSWCDVRQLIKNPVGVFRCLRLQLVDYTDADGNIAYTTADQTGYSTRPLKGGEGDYADKPETVGCEDLNANGYIPVPVWGPLIHELEEDFNWHMFEYDWRRWGDELFVRQSVDRFRGSVETQLKADGTDKIAIIGHSMGASVALYCLSELGEDWAKEHISHVILVAPAHLGAPSMVSSFAHAPFVDTKSWLPIPGMFDKRLGDLTASWPCMIAELPVNVGGLQSWPEDYKFAIVGPEENPEKVYKIGGMQEFLEDLVSHKGHREIGPAIWPGAQRMADKTKGAGVPTTVIYSDGTDTPYRVQYDCANISKKARLLESKPGDGTVIAESLERWAEQLPDVRLLKEPHPAPGRSSASHKELIISPFTIGMLPRILDGSKLQPLEVTIVRANGLKNTDSGVAGDVSDPYCMFEIVGKPSSTKYTEVIWNDLDPEWNHTEVMYAYVPGDQLSFVLWDLDMGFTCGDFLGNAYLQSEQFEEGFEGQLPLKEGDADGQGSLTVKVTKLAPI